MRRVLDFIWIRNELLDKEDIGKSGLTKDPETVLIDPNISSAIGIVIQSIESRERASHFFTVKSMGSSFSLVMVMFLSLTFEREREERFFSFLLDLTKLSLVFLFSFGADFDIM